MTDTNQANQATEVKSSPEDALANARKAIKANFNNTVDVSDVSFSFRTVEDSVTKEKTKRPSVTIPIPSPSVEGIIAILQNGTDKPKELQLLLDAVADVVRSMARDIINENEGITADNFPYAKLAWEVIANMPKEERRGGGIPKELWEAFVADYVLVMPGITGKTKESCELASRLIATKFASIKNSKPHLAKLKELIGIYTVQAPQAGEFADCIEFLNKKADRFLSMSDADLLAAL
jgi:hypothetical protein